MKRGKTNKKKVSGSKKNSKEKFFSSWFKEKKFLLLVAALIILIALIICIISTINSNITGLAVGVSAKGASSVESGDWLSLIDSQTFGKFLQYTFGETIEYGGISEISAAIITVAIWLLFFLTFSDIIATFSSFSKWVSWLVGLLLAIIAANMGFIIKLAAVLTGIFAFLGTLAIFAALGAALFAFVAVNLGMWKVRGWILKRKAMMSAAKQEAGGAKLAGTLSAIDKISEAFKKAGEK